MPAQVPKPVLCFIDDADFELDNFRSHAAAAFARVDMVYAHDFDAAAAQMEDRRVVGFLLDLYGAEAGAAPGSLPAPKELEAHLADLEPLDRLYEGLTDGSGEDGNRFLRRVHAQVGRWQNVFGQACRSLGQSPDYGIANLARARRAYPWAACMAYSRKSTYADADLATKAGVDGSLQKPQGGDEKAIAKATGQTAPELARALYAAVDRRLGAMAASLGLRLCRHDGQYDLVQALGEAADALCPDAPGAAPSAREGIALALEAVRLEDCGLTEAELGFLLTLRSWLRA